MGDAQTTKKLEESGSGWIQNRTRRSRDGWIDDDKHSNPDTRGSDHPHTSISLLTSNKLEGQHKGPSLVNLTIQAPGHSVACFHPSWRVRKEDQRVSKSRLGQEA